MTDQSPPWPTQPPTFDPGQPASPPPVEAPAETVAASAPPPPRRRRGLLIGAGATALALVAGAAVYATAGLSGGGRQPDELVPASTVAYLKVDLDPSARQKLAARKFFGRFDDLKDSTGGDGIFEDVLAAFVRGDDLDYARDVKPWFDKRAAVAAFPGPDGARVVAVLRSKDDDKARESLNRVVAGERSDNEFRFRIDRGYVVIGDSQADVDAAIRESAKTSLRDNAAYRADVESLTGDQVAVAWADLGASFRLGKSLIPYAGLFPTSLTEKVRGRVVAGVHLTGEYAELEALAVDLDKRIAPRAGDHSLLRGLPADTVAAVSVTNLEAKAGDAVQGLGDGGLSPEDLAAGFLNPLGLSLGKALPLLGDQTVVTFGSVFKGFDGLRAGLVTRVADPAATEAVGAAAAGALFGLDVAHATKGNVSILATPSDYLDHLHDSGGLGETPAFRTALGDTAGTYVAGYVDVRAWLEEKPARTEVDLKPLRSFGFVAGEREGTTFFRARLVAE